METPAVRQQKKQELNVSTQGKKYPTETKNHTHKHTN